MHNKKYIGTDYSLKSANPGIIIVKEPEGDNPYACPAMWDKYSSSFVTLSYL